MCGGVIYTFNDARERVFFPNPYAQLPVRMRDGDIRLLPWGRRKEQAGHLPQGGWARLDSIKAGKWQRFHPVAVKIVVEQFMEKDQQRQSHWFDLAEGQYIQGLVASCPEEQRVYVVTTAVEEAAKLEYAIHDRWPRII